MTAKHTPGPWRITRSAGNFDSRVNAYQVKFGRSGNGIAFVEGSGGASLDNEANARLIAAAPTMADAIRAAAQAAAVGTDADGAFARIPRALFDALENALDAATGEYSKETT